MDRHLSKTFHPMQENPWVEVSALAAKMAAEPGGVCNMGQGMSDMMAPQVLRDAMIEVMTREDSTLHQYTRSAGHPRLVEALAKHYSGPLGRHIDAYSEIVATIGADNALASSFIGFLEPGDETIVIEPSYDCYRTMVAAARGVPVYLPLRKRSDLSADATTESSADWVLDEKELRSKLTKKTKMIVINSPHNPIGKVYSEEELRMVAKIAVEHDLIVINDCVYENLVYLGRPLPRLATLPGMWERTVTIGSAGKSWNVTGWKLGWAIGDAKLIYCLKVVHASLIFVCPTPIQESLAIAFEKQASLPAEETFFVQLREDLRAKRERLIEALNYVGLKPIVPDGGYFITVDVSSFDLRKIGCDCQNETSTPAKTLISWLINNKRLVVMPTSPFYSPDHRDMARDHIRICINKKDETIQQALRILNEWAEELKNK